MSKENILLTLILTKINMEKILISKHVYLLGFELFHFQDEFNAEKLQKFLEEKCSGVLVENVAETFLRSLPEVKDAPVFVKIKKAYQNSNYWFAVFELTRPMYRRYKGNVDNTFVYIQGDTKIISVAEAGGGVETYLKGNQIYSCEE